MAGLTNYARHKLLQPMVGAAGIGALSLYVSALTSFPSGDGDSGGGDLTSLGAAEWTPARKALNTEASATVPYLLREGGANGGWHLELQGDVQWSTADVSGIVGTETIVGWALYDALSGGNMWAYGPLSPASSPMTSSTPLKIPNLNLQVALYGDLTVDLD